MTLPRLCYNAVNPLLAGIVCRWFDDEEHSSGKLATHLSSDATHIRGAVGDVFGATMQNLATVAIGYALAFYYDWRMALLITGVAPLMVISGTIHIKVMVGVDTGNEHLYAEANQHVTEAVSSIRVVQVCGW